MDIQMALRIKNRGHSFDMADELTDLLRREVTFLVIGGKRRRVTVQTVTNAGFNGMQVTFHYAEGRSQHVAVRNISVLPAPFVKRMITKLNAR